MINDNQLYSMGLSQLGFDHKNELNTATLELSTRALNTDYVSPSYSSSLKDQQWFYGWIDRQNAIKLLNNRPIGSFIVRHSTTDPNCFALTIRVPNDYQMTGIAHYLISATDNRFRIKVCIQLINTSTSSKLSNYNLIDCLFIVFRIF